MCSCGRSSGRLLLCIRSGSREPDTCSSLSDTLTRQTHAPLKITPLCSDMFSSHAPGFKMFLYLWCGHVKISRYHSTVSSLGAGRLATVCNHSVLPLVSRVQPSFPPIIFLSHLGSFFGVLTQRAFLITVAKSNWRQCQTIPLSCSIYHLGAS